MREIKFRAWIKPIKEVRMVNGIEFDSYSNPFVVSDTKHESWYADEFELMQYTGLKDKNGKEIYEGDIVYIPQWHRKYQVIFEGGMFKVQGWSSLSLATAKGEISCEVIGNIYENPELLEEE